MTIPDSATWHRDPETAQCSCGHAVAQHQLVVRDVDTGTRPVRRKLRQRAQPVRRREHCLHCDCRSPR